MVCFAGKLQHLAFAAQHRGVVMPDAGAVHARALAGVHLDKAVMERAGLYLFQCGNTVLHAVHGKIGKAAVFRVHAFDDAALDGEELGALAAVRLGGRAGKLHTGLVQPCLQLFKRQHGVAQAGVQVCLFLFRDARADKYSGGARPLLFYAFTVCQHGAEHRRQIRQCQRMVFLNKRVDAVAA